MVGPLTNLKTLTSMCALEIVFAILQITGLCAKSNRRIQIWHAYDENDSHGALTTVLIVSLEIVLLFVTGFHGLYTISKAKEQTASTGMFTGLGILNILLSVIYGLAVAVILGFGIFLWTLTGSLLVGMIVMLIVSYNAFKMATAITAARISFRCGSILEGNQSVAPHNITLETPVKYSV